jgi:hypothetical protein
MNDTNFFPFFDPDCGSGSMLREARNIVDASYNKQEQARLEPEAEPLQPSNSQDEDNTLLRMLTTTLLLLHPQSPLANAESKITQWNWNSPPPVLGDFDFVINSIALNRVTVDTIHLSVPMSRVKVLPHHSLRVKQSNDAERNRLLWREEDGTSVRGEMATWGDLKAGAQDKPHLFVQVSPLRRGWIDGDNIGCIIQFSIPGVRGHGDNSWPTDRRNAIGMIDSVQEELASLGLIIDLKQAKVTRCDLNRNISLDEPFHHYEKIIKALNLPRTKTHDRGTTMTRTNKSQGVSFYDKIDQMKSRGLSTSHLPPNLGRLEWEVKQARNVAKKLDIKTVQGLLDGWETLEPLYLTYKNSLFRYDVEALQAPRPRRDCRTETPIEAEIALLIRWCQKQGIGIDINASQLKRMVNNGNLKGYAKKIKAVAGIDRKRANTSISRMRTAFWRENFRDEDFVRRYLELKEKLEGVR